MCGGVGRGGGGAKRALSVILTKIYGWLAMKEKLRHLTKYERDYFN